MVATTRTISVHTKGKGRWQPEPSRIESHNSTESLLDTHIQGMRIFHKESVTIKVLQCDSILEHDDVIVLDRLSVVWGVEWRETLFYGLDGGSYDCGESSEERDSEVHDGGWVVDGGWRTVMVMLDDNGEPHDDERSMTPLRIGR